MRKIFNKRKSEQGSVTIEATIALTSFLFMFMMIYSIITICRAQAHIQVAINATAKEISQYSYLYGLSGLDESLGKFQQSAGDTKDQVNNAAGKVAQVFDGIQTLGDDVKSIDIANVEATMNQFEKISDDMDALGTSATDAKETLEEMAKNPQELLFGLAKLIGSESLELAKSRAIAEPVSRALIQKHLKRNSTDTANAFCAAIGIIPDTYLGKTSYFNGLDFSNSTLFPYGSDEISIIVTYKVKLLQLLPIDAEFTITQSAVTKGWLHGDMSSSGNSAPEKLAAMTKNGESIWNNKTASERNDMIRHMSIEQLKKEGYDGVSSETYIHAYNSTTKTFVMIRNSNALAGVDSLEDVNRGYIKQELEQYVSQMKSSTDNKKTVKVKQQNANGDFVVNEVQVFGEQTNKVIVVIPEDEGLKAIYEEVAKNLGSDVVFEFQPNYGTALVKDNKEE